VKQYIQGGPLTKNLANAKSLFMEDVKEMLTSLIPRESVRQVVVIKVGNVHPKHQDRVIVAIYTMKNYIYIMENSAAMKNIAAVGDASILTLPVVEKASGAYLWQDHCHVINGQIVRKASVDQKNAI